MAATSHFQFSLIEHVTPSKRVISSDDGNIKNDFIRDWRPKG